MPLSVSGKRVVGWGRWAAALLIVLGAVPPASAQSALARAMLVLDKRGVFAADSLYACLLDACLRVQDAEL